MSAITRPGLIVLIATAITSGADGQEAARPLDLAAAPPSVTAAVARAHEAIQELQGTLLRRLSTSMASGGPAAAIQVCRDEAVQMTGAIASKHGIAIGRTSHRLRNPNNAPRAWAAPLVASQAGRKAVDVPPAVFDLGDRIGVLRPIGMQDFCVTCHGERDAIAPSVRDELASSYPADAAVGFAPGDLRGWIWAEVPKK